MIKSAASVASLMTKMQGSPRHESAMSAGTHGCPVIPRTLSLQLEKSIHKNSGKLKKRGKASQRQGFACLHAAGPKQQQDTWVVGWNSREHQSTFRRKQIAKWCAALHLQMLSLCNASGIPQHSSCFTNSLHLLKASVLRRVITCFCGFC